jgi:hypothetical protein
MSPTDHEHTWVPGSQFPDLRCAACGASHSAIQTMLGEAAGDARRLVGTHYTGCRVRQESESLELWLFEAPSQVLQELEAMRPGVYLIHNDAPRPRTAVDDLRDSFDWPARKAEGIDANVVGPSEDGYLRVGVLHDVEGAQKKLDAIYGSDVVQVYESSPIFALAASRGG